MPSARPRHTNRPARRPARPARVVRAADRQPDAQPTATAAGPGPIRRALGWLIPTLPAPLRRHLTAGRLLVVDLVVLGVLIVLGCLQAFVLHSPEMRRDAVAITDAHAGYIDPFRSQANGHVWLTNAAEVRIDALPGGPGTRVLLDARPTLRSGQHVTVYLSRDTRQVRAGHLPGPAVLPAGQGAALLIGLIALVPLIRRVRRARRAMRTATQPAPTSGTPQPNLNADEHGSPDAPPELEAAAAAAGSRPAGR